VPLLQSLSFMGRLARPPLLAHALKKFPFHLMGDIGKEGIFVQKPLFDCFLEPNFLNMEKM
jgi:hypothetical protein